MKKTLSTTSALANTFVYLDSYAELAKNRMIFISENITVANAMDLCAMLISMDLDNQEEYISLYINTNGGEVPGLIAIYDTMQMIRSPIKTICLSKCFSAGAVLLAAGEKNHRYICKNAKVMIHGLQVMFPILGTDVNQSSSYYKYLLKCQENMIRKLATHIGKPFEKVLKDCNRDKYISAQEAVKYGLADKII